MNDLNVVVKGRKSRENRVMKAYTFVLQRFSATAVTPLLRYWIFTVIVLSFDAIAFAAVTQECEVSGDASTGTCNTGGASSPICHYDLNICNVPSTIYGSGGTAVAYVPNQSISSMICDGANMSSVPYRIGRWPFSRSSTTKKQQPQHTTIAPTIQVKMNFLGCHIESSSSSTQSCCCRELINHDSDIEIDVWQTRPDGTYSSITSSMQVGSTINGPSECRARNRISQQTNQNSIVFQTVAPGSTGSMYGLGPNQWDFVPYGPPVLHILVQPSNKPPNSDSPNNLFYAPTLVDVPIIVRNLHSLQQGTFYGTDLRGVAWVKQGKSKKNPQYKITSWNPIPQRNHIEIEMDIYVPYWIQNATVSSKKTATSASVTKMIQSTKTTTSNQELLCPSYVYGLPNSFFLEPIAVCSPSLLDFFEM
jgi:hypothetical protein